MEYTLFDTRIGPCGVAWSDRGLRWLQLPERDRDSTEARLRARVAATPSASAPTWVGDTIRRITGHLEGRLDDLRDVPCDMEAVPPFHRKVYEAVREVTPGRTATYRDVAVGLGSVQRARAVGQAMARNPIPLVVPCHRVLAADDACGGFSAHGGVNTKARILAVEGVRSADAFHPLLQPALDDGDFDLRAAIEGLSMRDPALGQFIREAGGFALAPRRGQDTWGALLRAIVYQQITGKAAETILGRVRDLAGGDEALTPAWLCATSDAALRAAGLSQSKLAAARDLAEKCRGGEVPAMSALRELDDETVVDTLTRVRGIGRWTVEMLLIFNLGRPDVLPLGDYGVKKGFQALFGGRALPSADALSRRGARWKPWRSVASWYLWRAAEKT